MGAVRGAVCLFFSLFERSGAVAYFFDASLQSGEQFNSG
jgi:hypothetical protein